MNKTAQRTALYNALAAANWRTFNAIRFEIAPEGKIFVVEGRNLRGANLSGCPAQFLSFVSCDLEGASFANTRFFPASFEQCNMQNVDLSGAFGVLRFTNCDLQGAKFTQATRFVVPNSDAPTEFIRCKLSRLFRDFLVSQGVIVRE